MSCKGGERSELIQKFLCWFFGHKTVYKAATGNTIVVDGTFDRDVTYALMKWERSEFCLRCGKKVHQQPLNVKEVDKYGRYS